jgi:hypothetical protein
MTGRRAERQNRIRVRSLEGISERSLPWRQIGRQASRVSDVKAGK